SVEAMPRTGADTTVVVTPGPAADEVSLLTMAYEELLITVPLASGLATRTASWTDPDAPAASEPRLHVTTPPLSAPPPVAETKVVLAGTVSLIAAPVAATVPVFVE